MSRGLGREVADLQHLVDVQRFEEVRGRAAVLAAAYPDQSAPPRYLALALLNLGRPREARDAAKEAVRRDPGEPASYRVLALAHDELKDRAWARENAARAVAMNPHDAESWRVLAVVQEGHRDGVEAARHALELAPDDPEMHNALGVALLPLDRAAARAAFERALALDPGSAQVRSNLALVDLKRRAVRRAAEGFAEALRMDPRSRLVAANLAAAYGTWLSILYALVLGSAFAVMLFLTEADSSRRTPVQVAWLVFVVSGTVAVTLRLRTLPQPLRRHLLSTVRRRPQLLVSTVMLAAVVVVASMSVFLPGAADAGTLGVVLRLVALVNIGMWVASRRKP